MIPAASLTAAQVKQEAHRLGFHRVGIAAVDDEADQARHTARLQQWLAQGYHAEMAWMANPKRANIRNYWPEVAAVIAVALNYYTPHPHSDDPAIGKISRYGWGRDYHRILQRRLKALSRWLESQGEGIKTRYAVDTAPIQDKVWAERAGLGWIGKHSNVITRDYGSWVFLGEVLINVPLSPDAPHSNHCGTCTRCLDACPTGAIAAPYVVDANRCIAYHTIENRAATLPDHVAPHLDGWVAGCDICQDVCPWNQRFAQTTDVAEFHPYPDNLAPDLPSLAHLSEADWQQRFPASALRRIKPTQWQRNARANLDNRSDPDAPFSPPP
jgi:epoxyqueuosine reductase